MTAPSSRNFVLEAGRKLARCEPGDEVVISGISGVFPDSNNVKDFGENLLNKKNLVSDDDRRWELDDPKIPRRTGKINVLNKFDAAFFGINHKQAHSIDPMSRILLEKVYEAVIDAGCNPKQLQGSNTGVFVGSCYSESEKVLFYERIEIEGFGVTGCSRAMFANRISYWLDVHGPSYSVDSACSSSLYAIEHAYKAIRDGVCDAAIVGGCNLCLHPYVSFQFARLGVLNNDGKCKSFDDSADGYCRSEAVVAIFLQKKRNARRVYASVIHAKTNCDGYKEQGITYPSSFMQKKLLEEFYDECEINPQSLNFIEAHATGTEAGDLEELKALYEVFGKDRDTPLSIGSVKSNMGHSEPASGLCSMAKIIFAFEHGVIPPNINLKTLRSGTEAFQKRKLNVVTEPTPWEGGYAAINNFGFGGANGHLLLNSNPKTKIKNLPLDNLPRLVCTSGRTEEAVDVVLTELENRSLDTEFIALLHEIHSEDIPGHIYRGYTSLKKQNEAESVRHIEYFSGEKRPIWFIFSGMGSQWPGMGKDMMEIPVCAESIRKSHETLELKNLDLIKIITDDDPEIFHNILNCFVGIAAIQIALVDLLNVIGLKPCGMIGHSVGELGCAYADDCFTAEQMIMAAYYRGIASLEASLVHGSMASIGLGFDSIRTMVPSNIDIACHNSPKNCTIAGPSESVRNFVASLQQKSIFAREVNVCNIAYHSRYIADAAPKLKSYLKQIIPKPKLRSEKWISSSNLEDNWNDEKVRYASAEYYTNNLLSSVYFEESSRHIPSNAIAIEIAPHGLLQAILKNSLDKNVINIPLMSRNHAVNSTEFLFAALGKLYCAGGNFKIQNLYPVVEFPVSRGTPMIAPLVRWEHSEDWFVASYKNPDKNESGERSVSVTLNDDQSSYLSGHNIDGRNLYPATGYLMLAWETISMMRGKLYTDVPVVFENVRFHRATNIPNRGSIEFTIMVHKGTGNFEVIEGGTAVVTGRVYVPDNIDIESSNVTPFEESHHDPEALPLTGDDIYKELRLRGYNYKGLFKGITYANNEGNVGRIAWKNNFVAFIDNMLQMKILQRDTRGLFVPTAIQRIVIDTKKHFSILRTLDEANPEFYVYLHNEIDVISCGGIEIKNLRANAIARKKSRTQPVLEKFQFVPHTSVKSVDLKNAVTICCHLALENIPFLPSTKIKIVELVDSFSRKEGPLISQILVNVLNNLPLIQADMFVLAKSDHPLVAEKLTGVTVEDKNLPRDQSCSIIIASGLLNRKDILGKALDSLQPNGFILSRESTEEKPPFGSSDLDICFDYTIDDERILLFRKSQKINEHPLVIKISGETCSWVSEVQRALNSLDTDANKKLVLYAEKEKKNGILGFFNCLYKEPNGKNVRCFFIMDDHAPSFSLQHPIYKEQFAKDLALNVYKNGVWGSYRHLLLEDIVHTKVPHTYVNCLVHGDLTSLKWIEGPIDPFKHEAKLKSPLVHVYYAAINFRDIMLATGKLASEVVFKNRVDQECILGFEYAGKTQDGHRYMGIIPCKGMASVIESDVDLQWKVPDFWSLEEAATIPVVYATVLYAFKTYGKLKTKESVLIHAGSGGIGQAAINFCLFHNCEIFTTVGTPEKKEFIKKVFPQIPESHIGNSRDTSFEEMVMRETKSKGVDLVLNSLAEEKLQASIRCLGEGGRFLEIGKFDLAKNNTLQMESFLKGISFHGVMLDRLFHTNREQKLKLKKSLQQSMEEGAIKPIVRTVFSMDKVEDAFRYMASGKHIGKVLLEIRKEEEDIYSMPETLFFDAIPRYLCSSEHSYVICGGLGGFGLELADWLVIRGARNLVLSSRDGITNGYQSMRVRIWRSYGVKVVISTDDITMEKGTKKLLETAESLGPVSAIFNLAVVLQDAVFENQTEESFAISAGPKSIATHHLDQLSRKMCPQLAQFVVFSSISCGRGNAGQTNYGMSNSVMERICETRKAENLPALVIQWGAIGDVGLVAKLTENNSALPIGGTSQQRIDSCLEALDFFMKQPNPVVASMTLAEKLSSDSSKDRTMTDTIANILGLRDFKKVSLNSTLAELGMDSMMAVEIKQTLEREFQVLLTPQEIRNLTFVKIQKISASGGNEDVKKQADIDEGAPKTVVNDQMDLQYVLRLVCDENELAKQIVRIPSLANERSVVELPAGIHPTVFVLPGIEGVAKVMEPLGVHLNCQVLCLQYSYEDPSETVENLAKSLLEHITSRLAVDQKFHIIGYSFGGIVALEMVKLLEENGRTGHLWVIDGSPEFTKTLTKFAFNSMNKTKIEHDVQVKIILRVLHLFCPETLWQISDQLYELEDWDSRLQFVESLVFPVAQQSKRYIRRVMTGVYYRINAVLGYDGVPKGTIKASTSLIRPTEDSSSFEKERDYGLSQYCLSPVEVHFVEGNHFTILENERIAVVITEGMNS